MNLDAISLQSWYATPQGLLANRFIGESIDRLLGERRLDAMLGMGYPHPYLERWAPRCESILVASPAEMGAARWPARAANRNILMRPDALPYPDESFSWVALTHLLEGVNGPKPVLREIWRVLKPGGRILVVAPNRGGLWARRDNNPFGWGRPFSPAQLRQQLEEALFIPKQAAFALFMPPLFGRRWERWERWGAAWEKAGERWFAPTGGVIVCEAEKVVYAMTALRDKAGVIKQKASIPALERRATHGVEKSGE
ncbi:class I SAM-dependent methyltransferase [Magnetofaba australis]|uniref:Putative type 11 methyltransferase n=1 Tax=Magnetofaba australis IT-1 TaxID=1434232 RepID=A0A1Y2K5V3_9PROT|nr:class I SAM-dependent methyltransferase [Magnetofaba australis]OSM05009.1 putative type 11 methyltransferase [Magnetofaba australis IT-1]